MLACTADGGKLPPYVIFKRKTLPKEKFPDGVIVKVHEKGWMDEDLTHDWIKTVWGKRTRPSEPSLLVLDAFRCHKTEKTKKLLKKKTTPAIIPGGMTSILQPLDVSINKPMKNSLRRKWNEWMLNGDHSYTKGGLRRKPDLPTICQWILDAWLELPKMIIVKAFKKCGISNALDGIEDDLLWDDKSDNEKEEDEDEDDDPIYADSDFPWTEEEYEHLFDSDSDCEKEEFYGFTEKDVAMGRQ